MRFGALFEFAPWPQLATGVLGWAGLVAEGLGEVGEGLFQIWRAGEGWKAGNGGCSENEMRSNTFL